MILKQRAVIVGCNINNDKEFLNMMKELSKLADACDIEVVGEITQKLQRVYSSHYIGRGKVQEVITLVNEKALDMVIFNDELTPSQNRNLEKD